MFDAKTIDWELEGKAIAQNTHLKKLCIDNWEHEDGSELANAKAFCRALSKNRSIKKYSMNGWPLGVEDTTCSILSDFFENTNLHSFWLHCGIDVTALPIFTSALAKCKSLREIGLRCRGMGDERAAELVSSLYTHHNLKKLSLDIGGSGKR
jgi:Ran GTPase-activating protein (RanGAP) involved in mRNA processing and transport